MLHPEGRFQLCPGVGNVLNPDPAQSKSKGRTVQARRLPICNLKRTAERRYRRERRDGERDWHG